MRSFRWILLAAALLLFAGASNRAIAMAQEHGSHQQARHFSDQDRKAAQDWSGQHKGHPPAGFRAQDRRPEDENIRAGIVLSSDMRKRVHPVPADLLRRLGPPPRGYRYVVIGGRVCEVDSGWHVADVLSININL